MSTQTFTLGAKAGADTLLDTSLFGGQTFQNYLKLDIDTMLDNSSISNNSSSSPDSLFGYDLLNFDQTNNNTTFPNAGEFQPDHVDHSLVLSQSATLNGPASMFSDPPSISVSQNNNWASDTAPADQTTSETQSPLQPKKRRSRKKKQPLPPAVKAEKRQVFLEKNRIAAGKCREKNRRRWDRLREQCVNLEAQNRVLKELRSELQNEVENMMKYLREHEECGNKEIREWFEAHKGRDIGEEIGVEDGRWNSPIGDLEEGWRGSERSSKGDGEIRKTQGQNPTDEMDIDMTSFLEDEVPDLSPSRKSSASTESDLDLDLTQAARQIPSRNDSGVGVSSDFDMSYGKTGKRQDEGAKIEGQDEELDPVTNIPSICYFTGQHEMPGAGAVI